MFEDFVKITLTWVSTHWLWLKSRKFWLASSFHNIVSKRESSQVDSLTRVMLSPAETKVNCKMW